MTKLDRKAQTIESFNSFKKDYLDTHLETSTTIVMYPPTKRQFQPVQFVDPHYISFQLKELGKDIWFLSHNQDGTRNWYQPLEWKMTGKVGDKPYPMVSKFSEISGKGPEKIDVCICPTFLYDRNNKTRIGGGGGNWKQLVEEQKCSKTDAICLFFNVQVTAYNENFRNQLMVMDYAYEGQEIYIPPTEQDKNNPSYDPRTGNVSEELPAQFRRDYDGPESMPEFIEPELRENPNFGGQGHFGGDEYVCAPLKHRKKPEEK